ncbi:MAG: polymorphic toxin type 50 domain-containing protein [Defluviitaleaceae bacterium]|nr:polymorphic toxin type 50 domain-containing protein [Defluviitaleaceae bacterium]
MNEELNIWLKTGEISKAINPEKQGRHYVNHENYIDGRSYLFDWVDPQELVDKYCGTGEIPKHENGNWYHQEFVSVGENIGVCIDRKTGEKTVTDRIAIHYSKTGTHIVPVKRR